MQWVMVQWVLVPILVVVTLGVLRGMGRVWGEAKAWTSDANSSHTSQRLADPYTFSHVLHGLVFYGMLSLGPLAGLSLTTKLVLATALEAAWEISENTDKVIQRYRTETISLGYNGDSVLNSFGDLLAMIGGFFLAHALPWWGSVAVFVAVELGLLYAIRDNLVLNVIQLVAPNKKIKAWQAATTAPSTTATT